MRLKLFLLLLICILTGMILSCDSGSSGDSGEKGTAIIIVLQNADAKDGAAFLVGAYADGDDFTDIPLAVMDKTIIDGGAAGHMHAADEAGNDTGNYVYAPEGVYDIYFLIDENGNHTPDTGELYLFADDYYIDGTDEEITEVVYYGDFDIY